MSKLADTLKNLKSKLNNFEDEFNTKLKDVEIKEKEEFKRKVKEDALENIIKRKDPIIQLNIGGKIFKCSKSVLISNEKTIFSLLYKDGTRDKEVLFFDRSYERFDVILNYLRTSVLNIKDYVKFEIEEIKNESDYYGIEGLSKICDEALSQVEFVKFYSSNRYSSCGTHKLEDLSDTNLKTGICVQSPYFITVELNFEHEFDGIKIGGWTGNTSSWAPSNGASAKILTSIDNVTFKEVGIIPSHFSSNIIEVKLKKSTARFIKFQHTGYLGLGYLSIIKN